MAAPKPEPSKPKREPIRTCVGCRETGTKADLVRLVRAADGAVRFDRTGKAPGRGAYLHPRPACWDGALKRGGLARALRTGDRGDHGLRPGEASTLRAEIEGARTT
ncbi:MAG: YlxR family protein [Actinomycetota bacterium]